MRVSYKTYSVPHGPYKSYTSATFSKDELNDAHIILFRRGGRVSGDIIFKPYIFEPEAEPQIKQFQISRVDYYKKNLLEDNSIVILREHDPSIYNINFPVKIQDLCRDETNYYIDIKRTNRSNNAFKDEGIKATINRTIIPEFYQTFRYYKFTGTKDLRRNHYSFYSKSFRITNIRNIIRYNNWPYTCVKCDVIPSTEYIAKVNIQSNNKAFVQYRKFPAAIKQNVFSTHVYDPKYWSDEIKFKSVSITVDSKVDVVIDQTVGDVSLVFQKNEFFEIELSNVENASNLPNGVTYASNKIKGSITNSGEYNIVVVYNSGKTQVLNIIIPFYRRIQ